MRTSISMLGWYMREYAPVSSIKDDLPTIIGLRFLADESMSLSPDYVYVGPASGFFSDRKYDEGYIVVHGQDFLLFRHIEYDLLLNRLLSAIDFYDGWERDVRAAAERHAPLAEFAALGEAVMGDFFVICDMETNLLCASRVEEADIRDTTWEYFFAHGHVSPTGMNTPLIDENGRRILKPHPYPVRVSAGEGNVAAHITQYLFQDEEPIAYFTLNQTARSCTSMQMHLIPVFCAAVIHAAEFSSPRAPVRSAARLLSGLITGEATAEAALEPLRRRLDGKRFRVLYFDNLLRRDTVHTKVFLSYLRSQGLLCTAAEEGAAALIEDEGWDERVHRLIDLSGFSGIRCGVSAPADDLHAVPVRFAQARFASSQAPQREGVSLCSEYAFPYLIDLLHKDEDAAYLLHPAVEKLGEYDAQNHGELLVTLREYLRHDKNLQKTLEALQIHRSTLKYRLQRIEDLTGLDLDDYREEAYLRLSLWVRMDP